MSTKSILTESKDVKIPSLWSGLVVIVGLICGWIFNTTILIILLLTFSSATTALAETMIYTQALSCGVVICVCLIIFMVLKKLSGTTWTFLLSVILGSVGSLLYNAYGQTVITTLEGLQLKMVVVNSVLEVLI